MVLFRVLCVLCLVSGIIALKAKPDCKSSGLTCKFVFFCPKSRRVSLPGCGFLRTCCKKREKGTCSSIHGTCRGISEKCAGLVHGNMTCPRGQHCCVGVVH
uniref:Carboxypeptidase inhibitor n=1 Tax=Rhipicephalus appendiculatus TaxID=34631 RepID=A0A131YSG7_RHIAP